MILERLHLFREPSWNAVLTLFGSSCSQSIQYPISGRLMWATDPTTMTAANSHLCCVQLQVRHCLATAPVPVWTTSFVVNAIPLDDDKAHSPLKPSACTQALYNESSQSLTNTINHNALVEGEDVNNDLFKFLDQLVNTTAALFRSHQHTQRNILEMIKLIILYGPLKRSASGK